MGIENRSQFSVSTFLTKITMTSNSTEAAAYCFHPTSINLLLNMSQRLIDNVQLMSKIVVECYSDEHSEGAGNSGDGKMLLYILAISMTGGQNGAYSLLHLLAG